MKTERILLLIALLGAIVSCNTSIEIEDEATSERTKEEVVMKQWLDYLCSETCEGRKAGTNGAYVASQFIYDELSKMGYEPSLQEFKHSYKNESYQLKNVIVTIPGVKDSCIVIGAHFDGQFEDVQSETGLVHYPAANDNASGVVTLLKIAYDLVTGFKETPIYTINLCFWDGEENTYGKCFKGSSYFVEQQKQKGEDCLYYQNLDSIGHNHEKGYNLYYYGDLAMNRILPILLKTDMLFVNVTERGKGEGSSDYVPFTAQGIPAVSFGDYHSEGCPYTWHSVKDTPDHISINTLIKDGRIVEEIVNSFCI